MPLFTPSLRNPMASPVCSAVQHDDSAEMVVDGVSLYREEAAAWSAAGFKQFCTPVALAPGWHDLTLAYGSGPAGAASVLRFFVVDAAGVDAVQAGGQTAYEITWKVIPNIPSHHISLETCALELTGLGSPRSSTWLQRAVAASNTDLASCAC